ncbi:MAG: PEGA domain-containing protein [Treponema sp.]|jgi:hypothetical protein|nr:PEGA domain-containing protein [Treponema sp.]
MYYLLIVCALTVTVPVFSQGNAEETEETILNPEWVLCVTACEYSSLPLAQQYLGSLYIRSIVYNLGKVQHRARSSAEREYYTVAARNSARTVAARELAAKRLERDQLFFRGNSQQAYKKALKTLDKTIETLEQTVLNIETAPLTVEPRPQIRLATVNEQQHYPPPPRPGFEGSVCVANGADALLSLSLSPFHGRIVATIKLWTIASAAYTYEDSILFSLEDSTEALEELITPFIAAVSAEAPATLNVHTTPADTLVSVNGVLVRDIKNEKFMPGTAEISVSADGYETNTTVVELKSEELTELFVDLRPFGNRSLIVDAQQPSRVYRGSEYLGDTPLHVTIPADQTEYLRLESMDGRTASAIIEGGAPLSNATALKPFLNYTSPQAELEKKRRQFYNAFGRFWLTLPIAILATGINSSETVAGNLFPNIQLNRPLTMSITVGSWVLFGLTTAEVIYRASRYIGFASEGVPSTIR